VSVSFSRETLLHGSNFVRHLVLLRSLIVPSGDVRHSTLHKRSIGPQNIPYDGLSTFFYT
jgi:hypothetical protein